MRHLSSVFLSAFLFSFAGYCSDIVIPSGTTLQPGDQLPFPITLARPAAYGVVVSLASSDPSKVTISPANVFIPQGNTTLARPPIVTGIAYGQAVITASAFAMTGDSQVVTVAAPGAIILPTGLALTPAESTPFSIRLTTPAPSEGVVVSLTSSDSSRASISPSSVSVPYGSTAPLSQPQITGWTYGVVTIGATAPGYSAASQTVQIKAVQSTASLAFPSASTAISSGLSYLQLTLSGPAPAAGLTVALQSSNSSVATVPASVLFASGASSVSIPVTGSSAGSTTISATSTAASGASIIVMLTSGRDIVLPSGIVVAPGQQANFPVGLANPSSTGVLVNLASSDPSKATISPAAVFIPQGQTSLTRNPVLTGVAAGSTTISATAFGLNGDSQVVLVGAAANLVPDSLTISGIGSGQQLSLTLSSPASSNVIFSLSSTNPNVATVPSTATVLAGFSSVVVPVTAMGPGTAVIHASSPPQFGDVASTVNVVSAGTLSLPANVVVPLGQSVSYSIAIGSPAPAGGTIVTLASSDPSKLSISPSSVSIPVGATAPVSLPQLTGLGVGTVTVSASAPGATTASQTVQVNVTARFSSSTVTLAPKATQNLSITLSAPLTSVLTLNLSSSDPSVATVPASVSFPAGTTTAGFTLTGAAAGSASITASATNVSASAMTVTVTGTANSGTITLPSGLLLNPNQAAPFPITLSPAAPFGGTTVSLSSNSSAVTITPAAAVSAGSATPSTQPQISGTAYGTYVITASAPGYTTVTQMVQVGATLSFSPVSLTISGITSANLQLNLSSPAPASGLTVNLLSSSRAVVTVPATVTFAANSTSVNVSLTAVSASSATITATSGLAEISSASATATVVTGGTSGGTTGSGSSGKDIVLPTNAVVAPGQSVAYPVSLALPAASTGVLLTLTSSDSSKATVYPDSIFIQAGQTTGRSTPQLTGVSVGTATITASAFGLTGDTQSVLVSTTGGTGTSGGTGGSSGSSGGTGGTSGTGTMAFSPSVLTITGTGNQQTLALIVPVSSVAFSVTLASSNSAVATVPASISVPAGISSVSVPITATSVGSAVIRASASGYTDATATVTVSAATSGSGITLPSNISVTAGQSVWFTVKIPSPAPMGGVNVMLSSSNSAIAGISAMVNIPAGSNTPDVQAVLTGYGQGTAAITATSAGYTSATQTVTVTPTDATVSWHGACWTQATFYGITGNFQGVDYELTTSTPVTINGTLFFNDKCDPTYGGDNMNDFGTTSTSGHRVQGFTHYPDVIPSSAMYWAGPRTANGLCPAGFPCSGCLKYTARTPSCSSMP
jgi:trimeric autotransporter adhesin